MAEVHPTACVEPGATLAPDVVVGPFVFVGREVEVGAGVEIGSHVSITGHTRIGAGARIFSHACLGGEPQDQSYDGEPTRLEIGARTLIREHATLHVGTVRGGGCTRIGDDSYLMNNAHVGHDCQVGNHVVLSPFCGLGGHVVIEDFAVLGAYAGVHQFARVGESAMVAAGTKLRIDAPPFSTVGGERGKLLGVNTVGLRRRGFSREVRERLKHAFHLIFGSKLLLEDALARVDAEIGGVPEVERLVSFLRKTERGFCR